jgi:hypothetical protein
MVGPLAFKLLLIGIIIFSLSVIIFVPSSMSSSRNQFLDENIKIPDMRSFSLPISERFVVKANSSYFFKVQIDANSTIVGSFQEANKLCILFYVLNETGMKKWLSGVDVSREAYIYSKVSTNFTITFTSTGTYYFVFDNRVIYHDIVCRDKLVLLKVTLR